MLKDRSGRKVEVGQLVDIHIPMIATAFVTNLKESPIIIPGQGSIPAGIEILIKLTIPADDSNTLPIYIVREASKSDDKPPKMDVEQYQVQ